MSQRSVWIAWGLAVWLAACTEASPAVLPSATVLPTTPPTSGIEGLVTIGPTCPVETVTSPCPDKLFQATIIVLDPSGREVAKVQSDAQGKFRVTLSPGTYTLRPEAPGGLTRAGEQTVTVTSGHFTQVSISYDSGIR